MPLEVILRDAGESDVEALAQLKKDYLCQRYRGSVPDEVIDELVSQDYQSVFQDWLLDGIHRIAVAEHAGRVDAYIVYRTQQEDSWGMIVDARDSGRVDSSVDRALLDFAVRDLVRQGPLKGIQLWLMRKNYRARFFFENYGFHQDGTIRTEARADSQYEFARFAYPLQS